MNWNTIRSGVAACLLDALSDIEAAQALDLPVQTVRRVIRELCEHWQARNRVDLAIKLDRIARTFPA